MRRRMRYSDRVASDCGIHLDNRIMGIISDRIGAQLAEMRARHAQTDREIAELKREAHAAFERWQQAADALDAELAD